MRLSSKILIISISLLVIILLSDQIFATSFIDDTEFVEGNIKYIFKSGVEIDDFEIHSGGIELNSDEKFGFNIQGGEVSITFSEFTEDSKILIINSSLPQKINFQITSDGKKQYLSDGKSYYLNSYDIGNDLVEFEVVDFNEDKITSDVVKRVIEKLSWYEKKMFEFEINKTTDENGIISSDVFAVTYLIFTIFMIILIIISMVVFSK